MPSALTFDRLLEELRRLALTFLMVAVTCAVIFLIIRDIGLTRGTVIFLIPVLVAASRWGLLSALFASLLGMLASAFFFFPPLYSLRVREPQEVINRLLYIVVAVVVSQLASRLKGELENARRREIDLRDLYAFPAAWREPLMPPTFTRPSRTTLPTPCSAPWRCLRARRRLRMPAMDGRPPAGCRSACRPRLSRSHPAPQPRRRAR
jgi:hypothetical protein